MFYQDASNSGSLMYAVQSPAQTGGWQSNLIVPGAFMSFSPSAVVFEGQLWVFYQGGGNDGNLYYSILPATGAAWQVQQQVQDAGISASPSAIVMGGVIAVFYQGQGNSGNVWRSTISAFTVSSSTEVSSMNGGSLGITGSPGAFALSNSEFHLYHQGGRGSGYLWLYDSASQQDNYLFYGGTDFGNPSDGNVYADNFAVATADTAAGASILGDGLKVFFTGTNGVTCSYASLSTGEWVSQGLGCNVMRDTTPGVVFF